MAQQPNNPKIGREKNFFVMSGTIIYPIKRLTTTAKKLPFVSFLIEQTREAGSDYKEFSRKFQVMTFDSALVDKLTLLDQQVKVEVTGNISTMVQNFGSQRITMNKLIALDVKILEELNIPFKELGEKREKTRLEKDIELVEGKSKPVAQPKNLQKVDDEDLPF
jgi:hypothetical protein